ncbi:site-specific integrase [Aliiroseovarius sp. F47248L]|uniref:tyrosine-type recombinase/integrase n=1 Tax=Aliiroseovarius sp. F47248L TaxID=2926420 RepID=UPI001FF6DBB7|nr:site-specific integrase [Aliiroseovarius sp. F47248L]MCK0138937.1 site-specific integrase [Aliiroseovarius sp. F47248L]
MKLRLTDLAVKKLPFASNGQVTYWDELTPNFGIRCSTRSKSYVVLLGEKRRRKTLGRYPELSLANARKQAKLLLSTQALEPSKTPEHECQTVIEAYLSDCESRVRPTTMKGYNLYLRGISFAGPISKITGNDVLIKIAKQTQSPSSQNYAFTTFKVFFNWAVRRGYLTSNPLSPHRRPHRMTPRERVLNDDELRALLFFCRENTDRFGQIVQLLVFTGQRKGEIANLEWQDIDRKRLILPGRKTKNKREHVLPLGKNALDLISQVEGGATYVFGTTADDKPFNGFGKSTRRMLSETGLSHFTLHDLRRTFATIHAKIGTPVHVTEKLLNHTSGTISGVAAVYNRHSYQQEMQAAVAEYDKYIARLNSA